MEQHHRERILRNLARLTQIQNVTLLYAELIARNVFTEDMIESIQCSRRNTREQHQQLFLASCKRGPSAFGNIVQALARTGNVAEARLLDPDGVHQNLDDDLNLNTINTRHLECESAHASTSVTAHHSTNTIRPPPTPIGNNSTGTISNEEPYQMTSSPTGLALIINVVDFDGKPDLRRDGADKDVLSLRRMLKHFGYEVFLVINPKKKDLLCPQNGVFKNFTDRFTTRAVDACIVAIMSHGEDNFWIQTSDCESIVDEYAHMINLWDDILPRFNNHFFPMMRNKPKLFLIQSCRGEREHRRVRVTPVSNYYSRQIRYDSGRRQDPPENDEHHPEFNHMILLQSTIPGYVTVRHEDNGSPFIQTVCQVFQQLGQHSRLIDMVPVIARKLQELPQEDGGPQTCTFKTIGYVKPFQFPSIAPMS